MLKTKYRLLALGAVLIAAVLPGATTNAATTTFPGSITLLGPTANSAVSGTVSVDWRWKGGKSVKSTSLVDLALTSDGVRWTTVSAASPIRSGSVDWATRLYSDRTYAIRAQVRGTTIRSIASPIFVDNTAPEVDITRPAPTQVVIDDTEVRTVYYISGTSTVAARAEDRFTGVESVVWKLDDEVIGEGASVTYNFGAKPGQHVLTVTAADAAGNTTEVSIDVVVVPGPSTAGSPPEPPEPPVDPSSLPVPIPTP